MSFTTILGYVHSGVEHVQTKEKSFFKIGVTYSQGKKDYIFATVYLSHQQADYLKDAEKNEPLIFHGETHYKAYINKLGEPKVACHLYAKSVKRIHFTSTIKQAISQSVAPEILAQAEELNW